MCLTSHFQFYCVHSFVYKEMRPLSLLYHRCILGSKTDNCFRGEHSSRCNKRSEETLVIWSKTAYQGNYSQVIDLQWIIASQEEEDMKNIYGVKTSIEERWKFGWWRRKEFIGKMEENIPDVTDGWWRYCGLLLLVGRPYRETWFHKSSSRSDCDNGFPLFPVCGHPDSLSKRCYFFYIISVNREMNFSSLVSFEFTLNYQFL